VEPAVRERAAAVIADIGDRVQSAIIVEDRDSVALDLYGQGSPGHEVRLASDAVPG
jgi:hypothetical protein